MVGNTRIKVFPDGSQSAIFCNRAIFWDGEGERPEKKVKSFGRKNKPDNGDRALRRARSAIFDIARANKFKFFVTLTIDGSRCDREDGAAIYKALKVWLSNAVQRRGLAYIIVAERHKKGGYHFHGLFDGNLPLIDSGTVLTRAYKKPVRKALAQSKGLDGRVVYNIPSWKLGFSTAIEIVENYDKTVGYLCKYLFKDGAKLNGRYFLHGGQLAAPSVYIEQNIIDFEQMRKVVDTPAGSIFVAK